MPSLSLTATITDDLTLKWDSPARLLAFLAPGKGKQVQVTFERDAKRRTNRQNSRYFSAFVPFIQEMMEQRTSTPWSKDMAHDLCCRVFIGTVTVQVGGEVHTFRKKSSVLDTKQFSEFSDKVERWIQDEWKINPELLMAESEIA